VQIAAERRYQRRPTRAQIERAFAEGATIYMPQVHQVLPRVARLMPPSAPRSSGRGGRSAPSSSSSTARGARAWGFTTTVTWTAYGFSSKAGAR
jgi:hypothetical protein